MATKIDKLRQDIDKIDAQLLKLLDKRVKLASSVGKEKEAKPQGKNKGKEKINYLVPERQAQILERARAYAKAHPHISQEQLRDVFQEIMTLCLSAETTTKVVYLGPPGTFTQQATMKYFGKSTTHTPVHSIPEVFRDVEAGNSQYGVVPIENSSEGMVTNTMDVLIDSKLNIVGEVSMPIHHCLLAHPWAKSLEDIKIVISHQQSISQCYTWLNEHLPKIEIRVENSNARAAQLTKQTPGAAAIASELNEKLYGLNALANNIEDHPDNTTRFLVVGEQETKPTGNDKTSLVMGAKNEPGSLYRLLECFYDENLDLNLLESRPTKMGNWKYNFFVDFYGHFEDKKVASAFAKLKKRASFLKLLGSYPCST